MRSWQTLGCEYSKVMLSVPDQVLVVAHRKAVKIAYASTHGVVHPMSLE